MKIFPWLGVLIPLVFGIGWTSRLLSEVAAGQEPAAAEQADAQDPSRGDPRVGFGSSHRGPFFESVKHLSDDLELTQEQRDDLERIASETAERVRELERQIFAIQRDALPRAEGVLTDAQKQQMDEILKSRRERYRQYEIDRRMQWFESELELDDAGLTKVRAAIEVYEKDKHGYFNKHVHGERSKEEVSARMQQLLNTRNHFLLTTAKLLRQL